MSRQEDFIDAGIQYRLKHGGPMAISGGTWAEMAHEMNRALPFEAGAEYGYQYAQTHPNWISVEEELPKERGKLYLVCDKYGRVCESAYDVEDDIWYRQSGTVLSPTHWMPLPIPPQGKEDKE